MFFLALWATPVHLPVLYVLGKVEPAPGAFVAAPFFDFSAAVRGRADEDRFAGAAPIFSFFYFTADRALIHEDHPSRGEGGRKRKPDSVSDETASRRR